MLEDYLENEIFTNLKNDLKMKESDFKLLLQKYPGKSHLVFPENRQFAIHMTTALPERWKDRNLDEVFEFAAQPGEFYVFQLGVYATKCEVKDIKLDYSDFTSFEGRKLSSAGFHCFNLGGTDCNGNVLTKKVSVPKGKIQALWIGIEIPQNMKCSKYNGQIVLRSDGLEETHIKLCISVSGQIVKNSGFDDLWRYSRLKWLDSTIAIDDELTAPFTPLMVQDSTIKCLGREMSINASGMPESIKSFYTPEIDHLLECGREILASAAEFKIEGLDGSIKWQNVQGNIVNQSPGLVSWVSESTDGNLTISSRATMEYDGYISYKIDVTASTATRVKDIRLEIPYKNDAAAYMMGMGCKGGYRPKELDWKWDSTLNQDTLWMGDVNAGLMVRLKGPNYEKPFMLIYYHYKPLNIPQGWDNEGKGGCTVKESGDNCVIFSAYSGERVIKPGEKLEFYFDFSITPVKPINKNEHWNTRYYHEVPTSFKDVVKATANVINIHHAKEINPFINYPFFETEKLSAFVKKCHENSICAKLYYTVKEITVRMIEFWAIKSLGDEVISDTEKKGASWQGAVPDIDKLMDTYIHDHFITAWRQRVNHGKYKNAMEASVVVNPMSRFNNYFLEGLQWLLDNTGIDGLYFDDVAFDRSIMKRIRKIIDRDHSGCMIDLHSWNYFKNNNVDDSRLAGWGNSSNLYIDNFSFIDRIWFGEGFDYNETPDFWLVEMSGIPFGVMGEMLQNGGNVWCGMLYGMTNRLPNENDPSGVWKLWDDFGISNSTMLGYWNPACPIKTSNEKVLATVYKKADKVLISLASWATETLKISLDINYNALGFEPKKVKLTTPEIICFQEKQDFTFSKKISIEAGKGWLIILSEE